MIDCDWDALQCTNGLTSCVFQFRVIYSYFSSGSVPAVTLYLKSATQEPSTSILQDSHFDFSTVCLPRNVVDTCKLSGSRTGVLEVCARLGYTAAALSSIPDGRHSAESV